MGVMDHVYSPSYLGDRRDRRILVQGQPGQKIIKTPSISKNKVGMVVHACNPSYKKGMGRKSMVQGLPGQKVQDPI
jgi:hypothetical protein